MSLWKRIHSISILTLVSLSLTHAAQAQNSDAYCPNYDGRIPPELIVADNGWMNHDGGDRSLSNHVAASDWLFTAELVPLPSAAGLGLAGLLGVGARRRRSV